MIAQHRQALAQKQTIGDDVTNDLDPDATLRKRKHYDFLDILLLARDSEGNALSEQEVLDEVETFMFEGHDTTASAISWCLYNLARFPHIQARARREVDEVLGPDAQAHVQWEDFNRLPYLTQCIKESMRLHPPVPIVTRKLEKPLTIDGRTAPPGMVVDIAIWNIHHNPQVWPDPLKYDPDRFTPDKVKEMDPHAFLPFSAGPRNCIGQNFAMHEIKTVVARVLHRFVFEADDTQQVRFKPELVLRAEDGLRVRFKERRQNGVCVLYFYDDEREKEEKRKADRDYEL